MNRKRVKGLAALLVLLMFGTAADYRTQIDGTKSQWFYVASGTALYILTHGGTTTLLGTANANDLDFNDDGEPDWGKVTAIGIKSTPGAAIDTVGWHGKSGGSGGFGWHETYWPDGSADIINLDLKSVRNIKRSGLDAKRDTMFVIRANNGDIDVLLQGS